MLPVGQAERSLVLHLTIAGDEHRPGKVLDLHEGLEVAIDPFFEGGGRLVDRGEGRASGRHDRENDGQCRE